MYLSGTLKHISLFRISTYTSNKAAFALLREMPQSVRIGIMVEIHLSINYKYTNKATKYRGILNEIDRRLSG